MDDVATILRLVGVYDADGSLRGELAYWVRARLGRAHCALCDITHGAVRERREWQAGRAELPVRVTPHVARGAAFVPFNSRGLRASALLSGDLRAPATIEPAGAPRAAAPVGGGGG